MRLFVAQVSEENLAQELKRLKEQNAWSSTPSNGPQADGSSFSAVSVSGSSTFVLEEPLSPIDENWDISTATEITVDPDLSCRLASLRAVNLIRDEFKLGEYLLRA